jgi:hypothetical protein
MTPRQTRIPGEDWRNQEAYNPWAHGSLGGIEQVLQVEGTNLSSFASPLLFNFDQWNFWEILTNTASAQSDQHHGTLSRQGYCNLAFLSCSRIFAVMNIISRDAPNRHKETFNTHPINVG